MADERRHTARVALILVLARMLQLRVDPLVSRRTRHTNFRTGDSQELGLILFRMCALPAMVCGFCLDMVRVVRILLRVVVTRRCLRESGSALRVGLGGRVCIPPDPAAVLQDVA